MKLIDAKQLALLLMAKHSLTDWRFDFNNRIGSFGLCCYSTKTISLSSKLTPAIEEPDVKNTILHEIAHAIVGREHGHDYVWQRKAIEIGCTGDVCALYNVSDANIRYKYFATCPICNEKIGAARLPKRKHWHSGCRHGFKPENILIYIQQY